MVKSARDSDEKRTGISLKASLAVVAWRLFLGILILEAVTAPEVSSEGNVINTSTNKSLY